MIIILLHVLEQFLFLGENKTCGFEEQKWRFAECTTPYKRPSLPIRLKYSLH